MISTIPSHSNIIGIKNFFEENNTLYHVMDYIKGDTLENYLNKNYPLNQKTIELIMLPFLEAVKHLHKYNILHRDIKLSNILMCRNGTPILIDFAISKEKSKEYPQHSKIFHTENGSSSSLKWDYAISAKESFSLPKVSLNAFNLDTEKVYDLGT